MLAKVEAGVGGVLFMVATKLMVYFQFVETVQPFNRIRNARRIQKSEKSDDSKRANLENAIKINTVNTFRICW